MLAELIEYLLTPCPPEARRLGLLKEAVAIRARHRRCRQAWQGHLERSRQAVLEAAQACPARETALVLGSGALLDIPLGELARQFRTVVLADMVHPLYARLRTLLQRNVRLDTVDLTGVLAALSAAPQHAAPPRPAAPALYRELRPDLTVSANVLSQLPLAPARAMARRGAGPEQVEAFSREIVSAHLDLLRRFSGVRLLLTDTAWITGPSVIDPLHGAALPAPLRTWTWEIAPRPETYPDRDVVHEVGAFLLS